MSRIVVEPNQWVEIFNNTSSGSFSLYNFSGRVKRSTSTPTDKSGVTIKGGKGLHSELVAVTSDSTNNVYVYNPTTNIGYVDKDV